MFMLNQNFIRLSLNHMPDIKKNNNATGIFHLGKGINTQLGNLRVLNRQIEALFFALNSGVRKTHRINKRNNEYAIY